MSRETFDRLRVPIALGVALMLLAGYLFLQRADAGSGTADPTASIVVGIPGGGVVTPSPSPTIPPTPSPTVAPTVTASASPTPAPTPDEPFIAEVMACRTIEGPDCIDEFSRLRDRDETFVALVLFDNMREGDVINAILDGPSGPIEGGPYAPSGSGRGWYFSTIPVAGIPDGQYTLTALRNGEPVARTELRKDD